LGRDATGYYNASSRLRVDFGEEPLMAGRYWIACGAILAATAVAAGAIGTHVLKEKLELPPNQLETFDVAVRYQMAHALGLILVGLIVIMHPSRLVAIGGWLLLLGVLLFSGGIYAWLFSGVTFFVHVVPLGGSAWIIGWLVIAAAALRLPR
jgi:uncharacterized membrane protein YgdD (TMEM256/DUF423 family)